MPQATTKSTGLDDQVKTSNLFVVKHPASVKERGVCILGKAIVSIHYRVDSQAHKIFSQTTHKHERAMEQYVRSREAQ